MNMYRYMSKIKEICYELSIVTKRYVLFDVNQKSFMDASLYEAKFHYCFVTFKTIARLSPIYFTLNKLVHSI